MADVADRSGVGTTGLYRRWGDVRALIMEVAVEQLMLEHPLPDTGTLEGDLRKWARSIASGLKRPDASSFFQALVATIEPGENGGSARLAALERRRKEIETMLARAKARGESPPSLADVLDHMLAPLYMRALFGTPGSEAFAERLVARLLQG